MPFIRGDLQRELASPNEIKTEGNLSENNLSMFCGGEAYRCFRIGEWEIIFAEIRMAWCEMAFRKWAHREVENSRWLAAWANASAGVIE